MRNRSLNCLEFSSAWVYRVTCVLVMTCGKCRPLPPNERSRTSENEKEAIYLKGFSNPGISLEWQAIWSECRDQLSIAPTPGPLFPCLLRIWGAKFHTQFTSYFPSAACVCLSLNNEISWLHLSISILFIFNTPGGITLTWWQLVRQAWLLVISTLYF